MSETPDIRYGRLLESAHISGYSFERLCDELFSLLGSDDWQKVGPGYTDVNVFLRTIDLSPFNLDKNRPKLNKRIKELQPKASERAIAQMTGTPKSTVHDDLSGARNRADNSYAGGNDQHREKGDARNRADNMSGRQAAQAAKKAATKAAAAEETQARRERSRSAEPLPDGAERRIGDAREVLADVADDSVALVLTDPPYGDESRPLYEWLGQWAARVLVPGGSLICYTGQSRLDRDIETLGRQLRYWWLLSMQHTRAQRLPGKFVIAEFKPVLWYVKEHRRGRTLVNDTLRPLRPDKDHEWGQGEAGVSLLIEQLTEPDELIVDPFAGSETWGKIAANMGRRWLGADQADDYTAGVVA